jgi:hypothetical protein
MEFAEEINQFRYDDKHEVIEEGAFVDLVKIKITNEELLAKMETSLFKEYFKRFFCNRVVVKIDRATDIFLQELSTINYIKATT